MGWARVHAGSWAEARQGTAWSADRTVLELALSLSKHTASAR